MKTEKKIAMGAGGAVLAACLTLGGLAAANAATTGGAAPVSPQSNTVSVPASSPAPAPAPAAPVAAAAATVAATTPAPAPGAGSASDFIQSLENTLTPEQQTELANSHWNFNLLIGMLTPDQDKALLADQAARVAALKSADPGADAVLEKFTFNVDALKKHLGE